MATAGIFSGGISHFTIMVPTIFRYRCIDTPISARRPICPALMIRLSFAALRLIEVARPVNQPGPTGSPPPFQWKGNHLHTVDDSNCPDPNTHVMVTFQRQTRVIPGVAATVM